ncbi:extracellular solute-binding protein [Cellulomonas denverensis]|uniref:Extracellular solute-binding protein n=1 Tax=Cellulomonas denverensis TaxID=264297 RepID=A0A7X6KXX8_9CELL|nr:extracellular solute-binding protein [Cellulomonas denverensis]NKY24252.1 extracellular solute-binding protein [Cellulomonas denverensis]GIG26727.1 sugar ABC transporter substrate-binding protein [Cellulomonas denverensis]
MSQRTRARGIAAIAALALALTACSGGSGSDEESTGLDNRTGAMEDYAVGDQFTATEPLTFSILYSDHPNYPSQSDWLLWSEITERTNVTLEPTLVPLSDYEQKRSLLIGAGDAPSIIAKTYGGQEDPFVASGAILPVSDYLDLMPNLQAKIEEWGLEDNLDQRRQEDGKFYLLPGVHEAPWQDYTIAMRTDVLDELGLATPTTWDEFRTALEAIKEARPGEYPFSDRYSETDPGGALLNVASLGFGTSGGWGYNNETWDPDAGEFVVTAAMPEYREMIEYFHGLVADGLMDPESFTQDDDAAIQKFVTGRSAAISANAQAIVNDYEPGLKENVPGATVAKIPVPCGDAGCMLNPVSQLENGLMISASAADSPDFVAMMQFIDWLFYSDEGQEFTKWGVEGTTYEKAADGTRTLAADVDYVGMNPDAPLHLQKDFGFSGGNFAYGGSTELLWSTFSDAEVAFQESIADYEMMELAPPAPLNESENEQLALLDSSLKDAVFQGSIQFILGQRDLSEWDSFLAEVEGKGASQYVDVINGARERYQAENG